MVVLRSLACALSLIGFVASIGSTSAAEGGACLRKEERTALIASGQVVPLATAMAALPRGSGEVVRARLCKGPKGYTYLLTLLARDGKVTRVTVDAKNGVVLNRR